MTKRILAAAAALALAFVFCLQAVPAMAEHTKDASYIYDYWGSANKSLSAFELSTSITYEAMPDDITLSSVDDVYVYNGIIYIVDSTESRVNVFDSDYNFLDSIKIIRDSDGKIVVSEETNKQMILSKPEGVYVTEDYVYIADTGNSRVLVLERKAYGEEAEEAEVAAEAAEALEAAEAVEEATIMLVEEDGEAVEEATAVVEETIAEEVEEEEVDHLSYALVREITRPETMVGDTEFTPSKITVDNSGRIFVLVQNTTEGIIELNSDGSFSRYFGVNSPSVNLLDYFWKSIASEEQQEKMSKTYAAAFSNLQADSDGFVYAVTTDTSSEDMVFRFNSNGENVLRTFGYTEQFGDLPSMDDSSTTSTFTDIAVNDYGVYALLDTVNNRVFVYNFDGNLISIFGGEGNTKGTFNTPTSIAWMGNNLIVGDSSLATAFIFTTTEFGDLILDAEKHYFEGDFTEAAELNMQVVQMNANYDHAYVMIGKNLLMQDEYESAMYYFKLGNDKTYYSTAFTSYRNEIVQKYFALLMIVIVAFIVWVLWGEVKFNKKQRELEEL